MKKKITEVSVNESSGAEKVEKIEKQVEEGKLEQKKSVKSAPKPTAKGDAALGDSAKKVKKQNAESSDGRAEKESMEAKERVEAALKRKELQKKRKSEKREKAVKKAEQRKKRMAEKKAAIEKRTAEKKARAEKHAAERKALAEKRKAEKEEKLRQRAHSKANRHNEQYKKRKAKAKTRSERKPKKERDERSKGYGGWIAAVVSLGVVSLALATTVTVGAVEMSKNKEAMSNGYKSTMYELTGVMENVDNDLDRVRISNSSVQQSRLLTDLLVQTRMAEMDLEKLPMSAETDRNVTSFLNRTAHACEGMLAKLRNGGSLTEKDGELLEALYQTGHAIQEELNELTSNMTDKDMAMFMKNGMGSMKDAFERMEKSTIAENGDLRAAAEKPMAPPMEEKKPHIEAAKAESLCTEYFTGYNVAEFQCVGETVSRGYEAYNVQGYDDAGNQLFAEISQTDGTLLRFDYYQDCAEENFDLRSAELLAEEFLKGLGYEDMEVVRFRNNGSTTDFTFVYEADDVLYYPDEIQVKVCRTRGVVSGFDGTKYVQNHGGMYEANVKITLAEACERLHKDLEVESSRLAVVATQRGKRTAYEFLCDYGEEKYFVYLDAESGEEISIINVKSIA